MKNKISGFLFPLFILMISTLTAQNSEVFQLPEYEKVKLNNGITLYLMEQHEVPLVNFVTLLPIGAVADQEQSGLAALTAEALQFGTKSFTKDDIELAFDFKGASVSSYAGLEYTKISASMLNEDMEELLPIYSEIIMSPVFPEIEIEKRKKRLLSELEQQKESPRSVIGEYNKGLLFGDHPYSSPISGSQSTVSKLTPKDITDFYNNKYGAEGTVIAVVGDFSIAKMQELIKKQFGDWSGKTAATEVEKIELNFDQSRLLLVNKEDSRETTFYIGGQGVDRGNSDYIAISVINTILGGRFTSWLNDELRVNAGLTYGARSSFVRYKKSGTFNMASYTATPTTVEAIDLALEVYKRLIKTGIDEKTLSSAKNYIKGQFPPNFETSGSLANLLADMEFYGFDESYINDFEKNVDKLTAAKTKEIIEKYFNVKNLQFVLVGKASEIKEQVSKYGTIIEKDIKADGF